LHKVTMPAGHKTWKTAQISNSTRCTVDHDKLPVRESPHHVHPRPHPTLERNPNSRGYNPHRKDQNFPWGKSWYLKSAGNQEPDFLGVMPAWVPTDALRKYHRSSANTVTAAIADVGLLAHRHFAFAYGCFFRHGLFLRRGEALSLVLLWIVSFSAWIWCSPLADVIITQGHHSDSPIFCNSFKGSSLDSLPGSFRGPQVRL